MTHGHADDHHNQRHGNEDHDASFITQAAITAHEAASNPHPTYATDTDLSSHAGAADPHTGYVLESLLDAKGDLYVASAADTPARLAVGSDRAILVADSSQTSGLLWDIEAWASWTPSLSNASVGNGTRSAAYIKLGRYVFYYFKMTFGSTSSMGTSPNFTLPVACATRYTDNARDVMGHAQIFDASGASFGGPVYYFSSTAATVLVWNTASTYLTAASITSTVPMTWTTSDSFTVWGSYEAAA